MFATIDDINKYISKIAAMRLASYNIDVTILDIKRSRVRTLALVRPVAGKGERWVDIAALSKVDHYNEYTDEKLFEYVG